MAKGQIRCISATGARLSCPTSYVVVNTSTSGWRPARFPGLLCRRGLQTRWERLALLEVPRAQVAGLLTEALDAS